MERLTALEFIPATDEPQLVRVTRQGVIVLECNVWGWLGVSLLAVDFEAREDLTIEGQGLGRPYWNGEAPPWTAAFDGAAERQRIEAIRRAALQHAQAGSLLLM